MNRTYHVWASSSHGDNLCFMMTDPRDIFAIILDDHSFLDEYCFSRKRLRSERSSDYPANIFEFQKEGQGLISSDKDTDAAVVTSLYRSSPKVIGNALSTAGNDREMRTSHENDRHHININHHSYPQMPSPSDNLTPDRQDDDDECEDSKGMVDWVKIEDPSSIHHHYIGKTNRASNNDGESYSDMLYILVHIMYSPRSPHYLEPSKRVITVIPKHQTRLLSYDEKLLIAGLDDADASTDTEIREETNYPAMTDENAAMVMGDVPLSDHTVCGCETPSSYHPSQDSTATITALAIPPQFRKKYIATSAETVKLRQRKQPARYVPYRCIASSATGF
jgi:hypothetical protein